MMKADYYREQAKRARRFALGLTPTTEIARHLNVSAQDFDELAEDIDTQRQRLSRTRRPPRAPLTILAADPISTVSLAYARG
jgi:hypothetical protein